MIIWGVGNPIGGVLITSIGVAIGVGVGGMAAVVGLDSGFGVDVAVGTPTVAVGSVTDVAGTRVGFSGG